MARKTPRERENRITRRGYVQGTAGAMGVLSLAGCLGGDGDDDDLEELENDSDTADETGDETNETGDETNETGDETNETDDDVIDTENVQSTWASVPEDHHFNPYNPTQFDSDTSYSHIFDPLSVYFHPEGREPLVAEDWSIDGDTMTININGSYSWHNGDPVTSQDVAGKLRLQMLMDYPIDDIIESINEVDESTLELNLYEEGNPAVLEHEVLGEMADVKYEVYEEFIEGYLDAEDEEGEEEVQTDLIEFRVEEPVGNGPVELANLGTSETELTRYGDYPDHGGINFSTIRMIGVSDNEQRVQGAVTGQFDLCPVNIASPEIVDQLPQDNGDLVYFEAYHGSSINFNQDAGWYDQREVRRAIAYILDASEIAPAIWGEPQAIQVEYPVGLIPADWDEWLGEDLELYRKYEQNFDRAAELLEEAGFSEEGGQWYNPDGNEFTVSISMPAGWDTQIGGYTVANHHLEDFGITAELETIENTAYFGSLLPQSDFDIGWAPYGGGLPHPWFSFDEIFENLEYSNVPDEVEVPPVGEWDGEEETVSREELLAELGAATDTEREKELVKELCWVQNYDLPTYITAQKIDLNWMRHDGWDVPGPEDPYASGNGRPQHALPKIGRLLAEE